MILKLHKHWTSIHITLRELDSKACKQDQRIAMVSYPGEGGTRNHVTSTICQIYGKVNFYLHK